MITNQNYIYFFQGNHIDEAISIVSLVASIAFYIMRLKKPLKYGRFFPYANGKPKEQPMNDRLCFILINLAPLVVYSLLLFIFNLSLFNTFPTLLFAGYHLYRIYEGAYLRSRFNAPWAPSAFWFLLLTKSLQALLAAHQFLCTYDYQQISIWNILLSVIFIACFCCNFYINKTLGKLRFKGERGYKQIPTGGLFKFTVCPHFSFEALMWIAFILFFDFQIHSVAFICWLLPNVIGRGEACGRWLANKKLIGNKKRTAVIPFVDFANIPGLIFSLETMAY